MGGEAERGEGSQIEGGHVELLSVDEQSCCCGCEVVGWWFVDVAPGVQLRRRRHQSTRVHQAIDSKAPQDYKGVRSHA